MNKRTNKVLLCNISLLCNPNVWDVCFSNTPSLHNRAHTHTMGNREVRLIKSLFPLVTVPCAVHHTKSLLPGQKKMNSLPLFAWYQVRVPNTWYFAITEDWVGMKILLLYLPDYFTFTGGHTLGETHFPQRKLQSSTESHTVSLCAVQLGCCYVVEWRTGDWKFSNCLKNVNITVTEK